MLSPEMNERLVRVGPGTPMGELLRRYWYPIAISSELGIKPLRRRLLGEDLVVYRTRSGRVGVMQESCPHRRASMAYGIPEEDGLRCGYHGWVFDPEGTCLEQPAEPASSTFKDRIRATAYPAQELGGMIHVYLGPDPAPLLPRFDLYVWEDVWREIWWADLPFSWMNPMENSVDPHHAEWLHGHYGAFVDELETGVKRDATVYVKPHQKVGFDEFEFGIIKRRMLEGASEEDDDWKIGHPLVFPHMLRRGFAWQHMFQIRVPVDDHTTRHYWYTAYKGPEGFVMPAQDEIPVMEVPWQKPDGDFDVSFVDGQDIMAWATQGAIYDRSLEHLGQSDRGIIMLRRMFERELEKVEQGLDPIGVIRDPAKNEIISLPTEKKKLGGGTKYWKDLIATGTHRYSPFTPKITDLFEQFEEYERRQADAVRDGQ